MIQRGDEELVAALRAGDETAYETLVRSFGGRLLVVAQRYLGSQDDARDAVQEAFLSAFRSIARFEGNALLSTWLHQIVINVCLMKLRTRRRKPEESIDDMLPGWMEDGHYVTPPAGWKESADEALERKETRQFVRECIDRLPEAYRTVLLLRDIEEMDTRETARLLGISEGGTKVRLHRARQALRTLLDARMKERAR
ncbi:MAG TPA: sigma-70 family RNA polymerase sigma factor [Candidatus Polarisedimenticolia bacterium]|nr:sigma-70 family RNA polymerase sigma factor [Candidatus Polarisedimenticolia bacterium]